jgi:hypothetical protein
MGEWYVMVTFTPNINLAKPAGTDTAKDWAVTQEYADDNNDSFKAASDFVIASYTPDWICDTANPTLGTGGTKVGEYWEHRGLIMGSFTFLLGTAPASGTGNAYGVSLPVLADTTFHTVGSGLGSNVGTQSFIGEGYIRDNSSPATSMHVACDIVDVGGVHYVRFLTDNYTGKASRFFGVANPFTLAVDDKFTASFFYKKA